MPKPMDEVDKNNKPSLNTTSQSISKTTRKDKFYKESKVHMKMMFENALRASADLGEESLVNVSTGSNNFTKIRSESLSSKKDVENASKDLSFKMVKIEKKEKKDDVIKHQS